jgi:hypothetical protein
VEKARACRPGGGGGFGTRASFRKFLVALENRNIVDIYQEITGHKDKAVSYWQVCLHHHRWFKYVLMGSIRHLDIRQSAIQDKIPSKIDEVAESYKLTKEAFEKRDADPNYSYGGNMYGVNNELASLARIASSLNRIKSALGSRHGSFGSDRGWGSSSPHEDFMGPPLANPTTPHLSYACTNNSEGAWDPGVPSYSAVAV